MLRAKSAFSLMEVAIAEMRIVFGSQGNEPDGMFKLLCPRSEFRFWSRREEVFRAHARELCHRKRDGLDLRPATDAECLLALSDMSLKAPLNTTGTTLYERLYAVVMGERVPGKPARETWPGAADEFLQEMRRKLRDDSRQR